VPSGGQIAAAANAIVGLDDEWDESEEVQHPDIARLGHPLKDGVEFRFFRRASPGDE
jgi:hypothetical protein